jgi:hypothetical protein
MYPNLHQVGYIMKKVAPEGAKWFTYEDAEQHPAYFVKKTHHVEL